MAVRKEIPLSSRVPFSDHAILAIGSLILLELLFLNGLHRSPAYLGLDASYVLKGQAPFEDIAQDMVGFRALVEHSDPYPILGPAFRDIGINWNVDHASTHPPTCFLLVAPIAYLPWQWASTLWAWFMAGLLFLSFHFYGLRWRVALGLTFIALLWPPVATSLGQTTILWLCGLAWAYSFLHRNPFWSGAGIAIASFAKLLPLVLIAVCLCKRLWRGITGVALFWALALGFLLSIAPGSLLRYAEVNASNSLDIFLRNDNSSLLATGYRTAGWPGVACALLFLALVVATNRDCLTRAGTEPALMLRLWMVFSYLAVALLPIAWIYSIVPLLPVVLFLLSKGRLDLTLISVAAILIPEFAPAWGKGSVGPLVTVNILVGIGLILHVRPVKFPFSESFTGMFGPTGSMAARS
jgi:hypothetical protein